MLARAAGLAREGDVALNEALRLPAEAEAVLKACAGLPLTLAVAGALCRGGDGAAWARLAEEWRDARRKLGELLPEEASTQHASLRAMIEVSMRRLPRPVATAYRGLALAPKRLPLEAGLLRALFGAADDATAREWRDALEAHSLLVLAADG